MDRPDSQCKGPRGVALSTGPRPGSASVCSFLSVFDAVGIGTCSFPGRSAIANPILLYAGSEPWWISWIARRAHIATGRGSRYAFGNTARESCGQFEHVQLRSEIGMAP